MKLPVFFHIPKNAGTYIFNYVFWHIFMVQPAGKYRCNLEVLNADGSIAYRVIGSSSVPYNSNYTKMNDGYWYRVDVDNFNFSDVDVFFVEICDNSFKSYKQQLYSKLPADIQPYEFLCLREPYDRIQSIYSYLNSQQSSHEVSHMAHGDKSFIEYLNSTQLEGGWLIRNLLDIPNEVAIKREHFKQICNILDNMLVFNTVDVDKGISQVFSDCYGLDSIECGNPNIERNKTVNKTTLPFCELDSKTQQAFFNQTYWDKKIYNRYAQ